MSIPNLLEYSPFSVDTEKEFYIKDNIFNDENQPIENDVLGVNNLSFIGKNIDISASILAIGDIEINGDTMTTTNNKCIFICSNGDITINVNNIDAYCILYAPSGTITINSQDTKIKGKVFADKVVIKGENFNLINTDLSTDKNDVLQDTNDLEIRYYVSDNSLHITQDIILPRIGTRGTQVTWESSFPDIIDSLGHINRPTEASINLELIATVRKGEYCEKKVFEVKVIKNEIYNNIHDNTLDDLALLNGGIVPQTLEDKDTGTPKFISGKYTNMLVESPIEAILSLNSVKSIMDIDNPEKEFEWVRTDEVNDGYKYFRLQQVYNEIKVYGRELIVSTAPNGETTSLSGGYSSDVNCADIDVNPKILSEDLFNIIQNNYDTDYAITNKELSIYTLNKISPRLAWIVDIESTTNSKNYMNDRIIIDAVSGKIIDCFSKISYDYEKDGIISVPTNLESYTRIGEQTNIRALEISCALRVGPDTNKYTFQLYSNKYPIEVYLFDREIGLPGHEITYIQNAKEADNSKIWFSPEAVETYFNSLNTYKYYEMLHSKSKKRDIQLPNIISSINYEEDNGIYDNAAYLPDKEIFIYGGEGLSRYPLGILLDCVAHEYTHAVQHNIIQNGNSRGMYKCIMESYADILGNLVEGEATPRWENNENLYKTDSRGTRSLSNPSDFDSAEVIGDNYYSSIFSKEYDEHYNAGILDRVAWKMSKGKSLEGIQRDDLSLIWYKSMLKLDGDTNFYQCREAVISAAKETGYSSSISLIEQAFNEAGICGDMKKTDWYYSEMTSALQGGCIKSYIDGNSGANSKMTYGEFVHAIIVAYDIYTGNDTKKHTNYDKEIQYAQKNGWFGNKSVSQMQYITREEAINCIWNASKESSNKLVLIQIDPKTLNSKDYHRLLIDRWNDKKAFADQDIISSQYQESIFQLYINGIFFGEDEVVNISNPRLKPQTIVDRGWGMALLMRTLSNQLYYDPFTFQ